MPKEEIWVNINLRKCRFFSMERGKLIFKTWGSKTLGKLVRSEVNMSLCSWCEKYANVFRKQKTYPCNYTAKKKKWYQIAD